MGWDNSAGHWGVRIEYPLIMFGWNERCHVRLDEIVAYEAMYSGCEPELPSFLKFVAKSGKSFSYQLKDEEIDKVIKALDHHYGANVITC
jgi:hypothetical protein